MIKFIKNCMLPNTRECMKGLSFNCSSASVKFPVEVKHVPK